MAEMKSVSPAPRVVLDTNVFVAAAFHPKSHAARILGAVREGRLRLIWNEATRRETRKILDQIPPISWEPFADLFREEARHRETVNAGWFGQVRDPDDRKFGALAYATGATLITQDGDLLERRSNVDVPSSRRPSSSTDGSARRRAFRANGHRAEQAVTTRTSRGFGPPPCSDREVRPPA